MKIELNDDEIACVVQALQEKAAADDERAKALAVEGPGTRRLAFTFEEQARKQRALAERIESTEG